MYIYRFTLTVAEPIDDHMANRLFEAGGDDAVVESGPTAHQVSFDREAATALEAVMSAVEQLDTVGLTVLRERHPGGSPSA